METPHTVKSFDRDLAALAASVEAMGVFATAQFADSMHALLQRDVARAERVIEQDRQLDALRHDVSSSAAIVIAKRQPVASDLSEILTDLRTAEHLERIGDLAKNIAKRASILASRTFPQDVMARLQEFGDAASEQLRAALLAYSQRNAEQALAARDRDETLDQLHTKLFRELVSRTAGDHASIVGFVHLLFCAKNIERIGDHAAHIAEAAYLRATGHPPKTERRRLDESSTLSNSGAGSTELPKL